MPNLKAAIKRTRQIEVRTVRNRYQQSSVRTAIRKFYSIKEKQKASEALKEVYSLLDRLAKKRLIHKNKASNLKSRLSVYLNGLK